MLKRHAMLVPAAALVMSLGMAAPSMADCDSAKLAEVVKAANVEGGDSAAAKVVAYYSENACAVGRQDIAMVRGAMSDLYGACGDNDSCRADALMASKSLAEHVGMGCDKDGEPLMVLDACTLDDIQKALDSAM